MMQSASLQCCLVQYWHLALESQNLFAKGPKENKEGLDLSTAELTVTNRKLAEECGFK